MKDERSRILDMLEQGTISADEALRLLEKFENNREAAADSHPQPEKEEPAAGSTPEPDNVRGDFNEGQAEEFEQEQRGGNRQGRPASMDEFLEDVRRDFTVFGSRFMEFMQTAVDKVKTFDIEKPFGEPVTFSQTFVKSAEGIEEIIADLSLGSLEIRVSDSEEFRAECEVKAYRAEDEEEAKREFVERFLFVTDGGKLRISSDRKITQVNIVLHVPEAQYHKLSVRLLSGAFRAEDELTADQIRVRAANGKIDAAGLHFKEAEFETANGTIRVRDAHGEKIEAETMNGKIDIDGMLKDIDARSVNGHVVVTTRDAEAYKIEAGAVSGAVEIYVPQDAGLNGEALSSLGRVDVRLHDVDRSQEQEQFLQKAVRFTKAGGNPDLPPLSVKGEAKTGTVIVGYIGK
ncbi:DUF4097 family beta strand repeat-containing protein [Edaphobacillus lindanitolerans]|uniref:DUF4097 and DUF4098 domain-containing protein YvlB n=1 Tax=Edaphobacillus lindanitolerans TaxID=550447 RepID=A0A1U7PSZ7_9BACI|nr:DUF4097 family beta strand repeat-containing protein [Edaphobacillus lindanitolerans]SIT91223.1 DUF4097 and DUF4098 domain-containing protein YvlB [Edaphobacillus lindanitolerans]